MKDNVMVVSNFTLGKAIKRATLSMVTLAMSTHIVMANPSEHMLNQFNQASQGDSELVDKVYEELSKQVKEQGATPVGLVYLGSTQTLQGREAFTPWNKMKFTESGLATIQKGLDMMADRPIPVQAQQRLQGLPEYQLATAMAATTYTSLPDLFNHFERGYELYLTLLDEPSFKHQPFVAAAWIYHYAVQAAIRAEDIVQAKKWVHQMERYDANNPETKAAKDLVENY